MEDASRRGPSYVGWLVGTLLCAALPAVAQSGAIEVRVLDAGTGAPLPGATVTLTSDQGLVPESAVVSDREGWARFPVLRAGTGYAIEVRMPGFAPQRRTELDVHGNAGARVEVRLGAPLSEHVEVRGERSVVDLGQVGASVRFSQEFLEQLPAPGRFYQDALKFAPGVNDEDGDGNPNVHGSRTRDFRAEVAGVSNVDPLTGQWLSRVNADSIEELEVLPQGAGVEFGRAQGGFARILQKQGSNRLEGVFSLQFRSSELDGDGAGQIDPTEEPPNYDTVEPALQISGPLLRDRVWFRFSHQYYRREEPVNLLGTISVNTREQWLNADQITWQVSPRSKLALQYQNDPLRIEGLGVSSRVPLESSRTLERRGPTYSLTWTSPRSERVLLESVLAFQDHAVDVIPTAGTGYDVAQSCLGFPNFPGLRFGRCENLTSGFQSGPYFEQSLDTRKRTTARTQATLYQPWGRHSHRIKTGMIIEQEHYERELVRRPDLTFEVLTPDFGDPYGIATARVFMPQTSKTQADGRNWAFYVEDQWKPVGNLSLTLGLRWDREEIESLGRRPIDPNAEAAQFLDEAERLGIDLGQLDSGSRQRLRELASEIFTTHEGIRDLRAQLAQALLVGIGAVRLDNILFESQRWFGRPPEDIYLDNTNFAPRLSLAWDPWSDGKTKLFASAGRYFDKLFLAVPLVELEPAESTLDFVAPLQRPVPPFVYEARETYVEITPLTAHMVDRGLRTPYQDEWAFGFERELARETSLRLTWISRRFEDQLQDVDINSAPGDYGMCQVLPPYWAYTVRLAASPGAGQSVYDPYTGQTYADTDPGIGDGRTDDCSGAIEANFLGAPLDRPDGRPDLYLQNPLWRELLVLGNFNTARYDAFVLELLRRQYRGWQLEGSYTWSRAEGDAEDFDLLLGNEQSLRADESGVLSYDQRHVLKVNAAVRGPAGIEFGTALRWESGLPYSVLRSSLIDFNIPSFYPYDLSDLAPRPRYTYPTGQRNDQRNPSYWTLDLRLAKTFDLGRGTLLQGSVEAFNALNDDTLKLESRLDHRNVGARRFGREWQLGLRLTF